MIRIDISKINNWFDIEKNHEKYIRNQIVCEKNLNKITEYKIDNDKAYKKLLIVITGKDVYEDSVEEKEEFKKGILKITMEKKDYLEEVIKRYEDNVLLDEYMYIDYVIRSTAYKGNIINNLKKQFNGVGGTIVDDIDNSISQIEGDEKFILTKNQKNEFLDKLKITNRQLYDVYYESEFVKEWMLEIFNYKDFCKNTKWNRSILLYKMGVDVCPYCNRQYITKFNYGDQERTTADLDHYYSQSKYPFLALSLYNFIPSCSVCNRNFKSNSEKLLLYPYNESFDKYNIKFKTGFSFKSKESSTLFGLIGESLNFELDFSEGNISDGVIKERVKNTKEVLKLKNVYDSHKSYVQSLIKRYKYYNKQWINDICSAFGKELNITPKDVLELEWGYLTEESDYINKPLSKLTKDIIDELGGFDDILGE